MSGYTPDTKQEIVTMTHPLVDQIVKSNQIEAGKLIRAETSMPSGLILAIAEADSRKHVHKALNSRCKQLGYKDVAELREDEQQAPLLDDDGDENPEFEPDDGTAPEAPEATTEAAPPAPRGVSNEQIAAALKAHNGDRDKAAAAVGLKRSTISRRIRSEEMLAEWKGGPPTRTATPEQAAEALKEADGNRKIAALALGVKPATLANWIRSEDLLEEWRGSSRVPMTPEEREARNAELYEQAKKRQAQIWSDEEAAASAEVVEVVKFSEAEPHKCPRCGITAGTEEDIQETFGFRKMKSVRAGVPIFRQVPQSNCRNCRREHAKERRAIVIAERIANGEVVNTRLSNEAILESLKEHNGDRDKVAEALDRSKASISNRINKHPEFVEYRIRRIKASDFGITEIMQAMDAADGDRAVAAEALGCSKAGLRKRISSDDVFAKYRGSRSKFTTEAIAAALKESDGDREEAAEALGCSVHTVTLRIGKEDDLKEWRKAAGFKQKWSDEEIDEALTFHAGNRTQASKQLGCSTATIATRIRSSELLKGWMRKKPAAS